VKKLSILLCFLMMLAVFSGCAENDLDPPEIPDWFITIEGFPVEHADVDEIAFTNEDAEFLEVVSLEVVKKKRDGSEVTELWTGVRLKDVLDSIDAEGYSSCTIVSKDGYSVDYSLDLIEKEETIIGWEMDGDVLCEVEGPVQMVSSGEFENMFVRNIEKIVLHYE